VFNIASTDGNPFALPGDSGSVIFDQTQGIVEGSYPAIGLLFAGGSLSGQAFGTLIGACTMSSVFSALQLDTICGGVINDLINSIGRPFSEGAEVKIPVGLDDVRRKAAELRHVRDTVLAQSETGAWIADIVARNAAIWSTIWLSDDTANGLAVRALRRWVSASSTFELLETTVDSETVADWRRLVDHMSRVLPDQEPLFRALFQVIAGVEGRPLRDVLKIPVPTKDKGRSRKGRRPTPKK